MTCSRWFLAVCVLVVSVSVAPAADPTVVVASGIVSKATDNVLFILPRGPDGRFDKKLPLKLSGTSRVTMLGTQKRAGKVVVTQRDVDVKSLQPNQVIAVIYAAADDGSVLLTAVVQPAAAR
jgi:hypothetical protein